MSYAISNFIPWRNNVSYAFSMSVHRRVRQAFPVDDAVSEHLFCIQHVSHSSYDKIKLSTTFQSIYREALEESDTNYCYGANQNFIPIRDILPVLSFSASILQSKTPMSRLRGASFTKVNFSISN